MRTTELLILLALVSNTTNSVQASEIGNLATESEINEAEIILQRLMLDSPAEDPALHELLGDVYAARGLKQKAQTEYARAETLARKFSAKIESEGGAAAADLAGLFHAVKASKQDP